MPHATLNAARGVFLAVALSIFAAAVGRGQCVSDAERHVVGFSSAGTMIMDSARVHAVDAGKTRVLRVHLEPILRDLAVYVRASSHAGATADCVLRNRDFYQRAVLARLDADTISLTQLSMALAAATGAVIAREYAPTNPVGLMFGLGFFRVQWGQEHAQRHKIIREANAAGDAADYIVSAGESRGFPLVTTGILARFRSRHECANLLCAVDYLAPTSVFGSVQFSASDNSLASNTALGFGWQVSGDVHFIFGYTSRTFQPLRSDLYDELRRQPDGRLRLPAGATEESIRAEQTAHGFIWALSVPIALRGTF